MPLLTEPAQVIQGERVEWTRDFCGDYPTTLWTAVYKFRGTGTGLDVAATIDTDNGTLFNAVLTAAQTAAMAVGKWKWWAYVTEIANGANVLNVDSGSFMVLQGAPVSTAAIEARTAAEIQLATIDAALLASTGEIIEYEISTPAGSRRVKKSRTDLIALRKYWASMVAREKRLANGDGIIGLARVRMPG